MKISRRGLLEIVAHEGIVDTPYRDSVGVWTVGVGHTATAGAPDPAAEQGEKFSYGELLSILGRDIARFEARVNEAFDVSLTQEQFDAAVSFDFNTGGINRARWVKYFNQGDIASAKLAFMSWRRPKQIIPRRQKECKLFFAGVYSNHNVTCYTADHNGVLQVGNVTHLSIHEIDTEYETGIEIDSSPPHLAGLADRFMEKIRILYEGVRGRIICRGGSL